MRRLALCLIATLLAPAARASEVDMQLVLAVDISRSMSHLDLATQRQGYAEALTSTDVLAAIARGPLGRIAVTYVEWSDTERQRVIVDWTLVGGAEDARPIAERILQETGGTVRMTSISTGLAFAAARFDDSPFTSWRRVIDVSGDGPNNDGLPVRIARDRIVAQGITINGLPVMSGAGDSIWHLPDLDRYYRDCVIGGPGAFVLAVRGWENFGDAIRRKLILEIAGQTPDAAPERLYRASATDCLIGEKILNRMRTRDN